jgi:hypothetical protein
MKKVRPPVLAPLLILAELRTISAIIGKPPPTVETRFIASLDLSRLSIYRIFNRYGFSGFWIKLGSRRDKSRLYGSNFLELGLVYRIFCLAEAAGSNQGTK